MIVIKTGRRVQEGKNFTNYLCLILFKLLLRITLSSAVSRGFNESAIIPLFYKTLIFDMKSSL